MQLPGASFHYCDLRLDVLIAWGWLEHHLCLFCADGEAEVAAGFREIIHLGLHFLLLTGIEGAVICKKEVPESQKTIYIH